MANKTRKRQLARSAQRRYQERRQQRRKRLLVACAVIAAVAVVAAIVALVPKGSSKSGSASASASPKPAACGGSVPAAAGTTKPQFSKAPDPATTLDSSKTYSATIETSCGSFDVALDSKQAPNAVASFVFLAQKGFFDGLTFHRIVKGFAIQGGDPKGDGTGGPGYKFANEIDPSLKFGKPGVLAMANSGPDTNGSQWFITLAADTQLNATPQASYTIFGNVTSGMNVVQKIGNVPTTTGSAGGEKSTPVQPVYIDKVTIHSS